MEITDEQLEQFKELRLMHAKLIQFFGRQDLTGPELVEKLLSDYRVLRDNIPIDCELNKKLNFPRMRLPRWFCNG